MNPLNKKIAIGMTGVSTAALATGGIVNKVSDDKLSKERIKSLSNIKGNSPEARKARRRINMDYNKEEKSIDHTIELVTAGAIVTTGLTGLGINHFM